MALIKLPTTAAVTFFTAKGSFRMEIWAKEIPDISRQFLQNCLDKKYVGKTFNKVIRDYLIQTESLNTENSVENEFHSRIKYQQSYLVGAVEKGAKSSTTDSFFITLKETPEFNGKYVIFGKIVGDGIYEVIRINSGELEGETPVYPVEIIDVNVDIVYFEDLSRTVIAEPKIIPTKAKENKRPKIGVQFDEDEEKEEEVDFKMKSAHELLDMKVKKRKTEQEQRRAEETEETAEPKEKEETEEKEQLSETEETEKAKEAEQANDKEETREKVKVAEDQRINPMESQVVKNLQKSQQENSRAAIKPPTRRDPIIDDRYDSALDLSDSDDVELSKLQQHKFVC